MSHFLVSKSWKRATLSSNLLKTVRLFFILIYLLALFGGPTTSVQATTATFTGGKLLDKLIASTANTGYSFNSWDGDVANANSVITEVTLDASKTVITNFTQTCYTLSIGHTGNGSNPTASPTNSTGCSTGEYAAGENISLSGAAPDTGWEISGWTGTDDDASTASTNSLTMPASDHTASVDYKAYIYLPFAFSSTTSSGTSDLTP